MRHVFRGVAALFLAGAGWFGWQGYHVYRAVVDTTGKVVPRVTGEPAVTIPPLNGNQRINFLILGSDNDRKKEEARPLTQSMIVVTVDPLHDKVAMLSIPRDFWVPIPGHGMGKIDLAHKYGGVALARETVERLFHIPIDYYAWVGLGGFIKVIDTFNGVTLDVLHPILDDTYPDDLNSANPYAFKRVFVPAGWQHMTGDQALQYVRSRHGDLIGDFGRSERQQQVLLQLDQKINALNVLLNIPRLADDLHDSVRTDLDLIKLYQLEQLSHHIKAQDVHQVVLQAPTYSSYDFRDGQSVVIPNWQKIRPLVKAMFAPIAPSVPAGPAQRPQALTTAAPRVTALPRFGPTALKEKGSEPNRTTQSIQSRAAPRLPRLSGSLFFVRGGNIFELMRGQELRQLTFTGDAAMPSPSPDGRSLAFVRFSRKYASDIWILDLRTSREHAITHDSDPGGEVRNNLWAAWPSWSSDGTRLIFSWDRAKLTQPPSDIRPVDLALWQTPIDGSSWTEISLPNRGSGGDTEPVTRPGSDQVLYVKWNYLQSNNQPYSQLVLSDHAVSREWALTPVGGRVLQPAWDPAGRRLTFVRRTNGVDEVAVAPVLQTPSGPQLGPPAQPGHAPGVVLARGKVAQPAFTPDGQWVSYLRVQGDGFALYVAPAGGGPSIRLDQVPTDVDARWHPVWMP